MTTIIDRRFNKSSDGYISRQKFLERNKKHIKEAVKKIVEKGSIKDVSSGDKKVVINKDGLDIPEFEFDKDSGITDRVHSGNKQYKRGDTIRKQGLGSGSGREGSADGEGEDTFEFILANREFLDLFFEDLELPEFIKKSLSQDALRTERAGYSKTGGPSSLNIKQTMIRSIGRRKSVLKKNPEAKPKYLEDIDLRYNYRELKEQPTYKAVMICLMDVSGSMGEREKDIVKRFFILLYLFLTKNYEKIEVVFVRHTQEAKEVDEEEFFYSKETGGTIISSGYKLIDEIIQKRYNNRDEWNIYIAQASDGDNWPEDNLEMTTVLVDKLLPVVNYMAYVQVGNMASEMVGDYGIWSIMQAIRQNNQNMETAYLRDYSSVYPVFRRLFEKEKK